MKPKFRDDSKISQIRVNTGVIDSLGDAFKSLFSFCQEKKKISFLYKKKEYKGSQVPKDKSVVTTDFMTAVI